MEQFSVPQFIDVESKIIGPITTRQFLLMVTGAFIGFLFYTFADFSLFVVLAVLDLLSVFVLAFGKVNGVPIHFFFLNVLQTTRRPGLRVWAKVATGPVYRQESKKSTEEHAGALVPLRARMQQSSLAEIALIVDTGGVYRGEGTSNQSLVISN